MGKAMASGEDFPLNQSIDIYIYKYVLINLSILFWLWIFIYFFDHYWARYIIQLISDLPNKGPQFINYDHKLEIDIRKNPCSLEFPMVSCIIELDDGKILTGKPQQFDGKNHGFL